MQQGLTKHHPRRQQSRIDDQSRPLLGDRLVKPAQPQKRASQVRAGLGILGLELQRRLVMLDGLGIISFEQGEIAQIVMGNRKPRFDADRCQIMPTGFDDPARPTLPPLLA